MEKILNLYLLFLLIFVPLAKAQSETGKKFIHPTFMQLLMRHPRDDVVVNPAVPRISGDMAYQLLLKNEAFFFGTGDLAAKHNFMGVIILPLHKESSPEIISKVNKIQKKYRNKFMVIFCT